jgi:hypothetical protein
VTAPYSVAFYADKDDLIDGRPQAQITYIALKDAGDVEYDRVREAIKRLIAAAPYHEDSDDPDLVGGPGSRWLDGTSTGSAIRSRFRLRCLHTPSGSTRPAAVGGLPGPAILTALAGS